MYTLLGAFNFYLFFAQIHAFDPVVQLPKGKIRGHVLESAEGNPYYAFQEIPFAAPPIGENRFKLPKSPEPWSGVLNTTRNNVICYQYKKIYNNLKHSEDCLYLNVYTPVVPGTSKLLPVLAWIHGGGFMNGSGAYEYYGPKYIMDSEVVVVTFNYRLGPFGFLTTYDDVIPANLALKDQYFALEWIHENIGLFGGNKSHVTIVGESAGSMAGGIHLLGPWKDGKVLFHAAILQSGSPFYFARGNKAHEMAFNIARTLNNALQSDKSTDILGVLQEASSLDILRASTKNRFLSWPIVEKDGIFGYHMYDCLVNGNIKKVPILIGFTSEEWLIKNVFIPNLKEVAAAYDKDPSLLLEKKFNLSEVDRRIAGNLMKKIYTNASFEEDLGAYIRYDSDDTFTNPILKQIQLQSQYVDVYFYQFSYKGHLGMRMSLPEYPGIEKVTHAEDLTYMWDNQKNSNLTHFPYEDRLMLQRFVKMWTNFVKYHNPTPVKDPLLLNMTWPKVDSNQPDKIRYLNMDKTFEIRHNPRYFQKLRAEILDKYITPNVII